jgi:DNA-binding winged helix-turn-helix (wHTH) protein
VSWPGRIRAATHVTEDALRTTFDDLVLDDDTRQLWVAGEHVHVSPKAFELLALLIRHRPRVVSKTQIHEHLWPGTFVTESSLPSLISELRSAIGDRNRPTRLIRTVHGYGYAFQGDAAPGAIDARPGLESVDCLLLGESTEIALSRGEHVLGRNGPGAILLKSSTVSRRHARIVVGETGAVVEDLGSKNGSYVNDRAIERPTPLCDGDRVRFGSLVFVFRQAPHAESTDTLSAEIRRPRGNGPGRGSGQDF